MRGQDRTRRTGCVTGRSRVRSEESGTRRPPHSGQAESGSCWVIGARSLLNTSAVPGWGGTQTGERLAEEAVKLPVKGGRRHLRHGRLGAHDDIDARGKLLQPRCHECAESSLHAVPDDGATHCCGHDETDPRWSNRQRIGLGGVHHEEARSGTSPVPAPGHGAEVGTSAQPVPLRQHELPCFTRTSARQADSSARPFRRRAARMARPARVLMRWRKPWFLARRRLFGWNVRLLTMLAFVGSSHARHGVVYRYNSSVGAASGTPAGCCDAVRPRSSGGHHWWASEHAKPASGQTAQRYASVGRWVKRSGMSVARVLYRVCSTGVTWTRRATSEDLENVASTGLSSRPLAGNVNCRCG